jgi:ketosteroid isomerase-like protein
MKQSFACILYLLLSLSALAQKKSARHEDLAITQLLQVQTAAWNRGDIEGFMQTYWKSDSLMFIGKNGVKWGWQTTLENYKKGYPDTAAMGKLDFDVIQVKRLSALYYFVVGRWHLKRTIGDLSGHFNLLLRKIKGRWVIVADHSS